MSRHIDTLPEPTKKTPTRVIVATASRTGTLSVYQAMKILGFKTYHMAEVIQGGRSHMQLADEAIEAQFNRFSGKKRYNKADFEKWFADYDCVIEMPFFLGPELLKAYADDPNVKFILSDRDSEKWAVSVNNTAGGIVQTAHRFPYNVLKYFDDTVYWFLRLNCTIYSVCSDGTLPEERYNREALVRNYESYIDMAKRILPADRLCYFRLEDGLGWDKICPFLGVPEPEEEWPAPNTPENFRMITGGLINAGIQRAALNVGAVVVPVLGSAVYLGLKYFRR